MASSALRTRISPTRIVSAWRGVTASGVVAGLPVNATILSWLKAGLIAEQSGSGPGMAGWSFAAADKSFDYLSAGQVSTLTFVVTLRDNHGGSLNQNVVINITGTNDAPMIASGSIRRRNGTDQDRHGGADDQ